MSSKKKSDTADGLLAGVQIDESTKKAATVAVVTGLAVAALQPALLPGVAIGAGAALSPKLLSVAGTVGRFVAKRIIKTGFQVAFATQDIINEVGDELRGIAAEARPVRSPSSEKTGQ